MTRAAFGGNLARFLQDIHKFPLLTPEEEHALAKRWRERGNLDALEKIRRTVGATTVAP